MPLRWLIQKQGYTRDESAIVCWMANRDMQVPDIMKDSPNAYQNIDNFDFDFDDVDNDEYWDKKNRIPANIMRNGFIRR